MLDRVPRIRLLRGERNREYVLSHGLEPKYLEAAPGDSPKAAILGTSIDHQHEDVRDSLKLSKEFVVHSLRHSMLTRLGEAGADAFTIMKIAGHSSVTVSQRYVHPTPEGMERAFERLQELNATKFEEGRRKPWQWARRAPGSPAKVPTVKNRASRKPSQVVVIK